MLLYIHFIIIFLQPNFLNFFRNFSDFISLFSVCDQLFIYRLFYFYFYSWFSFQNVIVYGHNKTNWEFYIWFLEFFLCKILFIYKFSFPPKQLCLETSKYKSSLSGWIVYLPVLSPFHLENYSENFHLCGSINFTQRFHFPLEILLFQKDCLTSFCFFLISRLTYKLLFINLYQI